MATLIGARRATVPGELNACALTLLPPVAVCLATALFAAITASLAGVSAWPLLSYFECAEVTMLCALIVVFWAFAKAALRRTGEPLQQLRDGAIERLALLLLPAIVMPAFLMGYTTSKTAIPLVVGYSWDGFWANADRLIFGDDVWRISRAIFGNSASRFWEWWYAVAWGCAFLLTTNFVALLGRRATVGIFFTALTGAWLIGGCFLAYLFSAAGPVFAPIFEPTLAQRFGPLQQLLNDTLGNRSIALAQHYLLDAARETHVAAKGGGISAFPSMHIATVTIYVLAARGTKWLIPAVGFWLMIFIGSAYFGFHYWIDGIVGAAVSVGCWHAAGAIYSRFPEPSAARMRPAAGGGLSSGTAGCLT
jgi:hypothetical protein